MTRRPYLVLLSLCLLGAARADEPPTGPPEPAVAATPADDRAAEFKAFRADFDAQRFNEALPHAERVVALTEALDAHHPDLAKALNNLGATQYRLGDYGAAEKAYGRALAMIEEAHGSMSPQLIAPLRGLALTYEGGGRNEFAVPLLERAVGISRRSHGLFNPQQTELLTPLIDGYTALSRWKDADRAHGYILQIAEHQFGPDDPRLFPALQQLGRWYANSLQRNAARQVWERMLAIGRDPAHRDPIAQIVALRGIAEAYRLDYQLGPEGAEPPPPGEAPLMPMPLDAESARRAALFGPDYSLSSQGQEALEKALAIAEKLNPPQPTVLGVVLVGLGDWFLIEGRADRALPYFTRALPLLAPEAAGAESAGEALTRPAMLLYRAPPSAQRHRDQPAALVVEHYAVAEFTVTSEGKVRDAKIVEGDATDAQKSSFLFAIGRATYRPRFVEGKPVATESVRYRESFRSMKS